MLSLVRRLAYRDQVLERLETLLVMYPRGRQFAADFPGLKAAIRAQFDAGDPAQGAAVVLAARMIADLLGRLEPAERGAAAARLIALDLSEMEPIVARQISKRPEATHPAPAEFAVRLVGGALLMARRTAEEGSLDGREHAAFLQALDDALRPAFPERGSLAERFGLPKKPSVWGSGGS